MLLVMLAAVAGLSYPQTIILTREEKPTKSSYVHAKYNHMLGGSADVALEDYMNLEYYGNVQLGTPAHTYKVIFDTVSSNLWVPAVNCTKCLNTHRKYDPSASTTYQANGTSFKIDNGAMSSKGYVAHDVMTIGGLTCDVDFGAVTEAGILHIPLVKFDGVLGLGWPNASVDGLTSVMERLDEEKVIDSYMFGFYLQSDAHKTGKLTIGGYDKSKAKSISWVPVATENTWTVNVQKLSFGGVIATNVTNAILDTGLSVFFGPKDDVAGVAKQMGATYFGYNGYSVSCHANLPDMELTLGSGTDTTTLTIKGDNLRIKVCTLYVFCKCYLAIVGMDLPEPYWILGNVLMREYYSVFDFGNGKVGFSALSNRDEQEVENSYAAAVY